MTPELERAIEMVEASGRIVCEVEDAAEMIRPKDKDADLRSAWKQILSVLTIAEDLAESGARLGPMKGMGRNNADPRPYLRNGIMRKVDVILATAQIEEQADAA
jgi:hypothetical protein